MKRVGLIGFFLSIFLGLSVIDFSHKVSEEEIIPNFAYFETVEERKKQFFDFMKPIIQDENARVLDDRERLLKIHDKRKRQERISMSDLNWLRQLMADYGLEHSDYPTEETWDKLKRRVDSVPASLALAQSANESAWGTSRFAIEGNSMFGQLNFSSSIQGLIPKRRNPGARHTVTAFETVRMSVRSYIKNLNTHPAYREFRESRATLRRNDKIPDGYTLAEGLIRYSERREAYIAEIREIILANTHLMELE